MGEGIIKNASKQWRMTQGSRTFIINNSELISDNLFLEMASNSMEERFIAFALIDY